MDNTNEFVRGSNSEGGNRNLLLALCQCFRFRVFTVQIVQRVKYDPDLVIVFMWVGSHDSKT
jgi:hypothetical protein